MKLKRLTVRALKSTTLTSIREIRNVKKNSKKSTRLTRYFQIKIKKHAMTSTVTQA